MSIDTTERQFEKEIELILVNGDYESRINENFDKKRSLDSDYVIKFLKKSQPKTWGKLENEYIGNLEKEVLDILEKGLAERGTIDVIRNGIEISGKELKFGFFKPVSSIESKDQEEYDSNILSVIRQVHYSQEDPLKSVDLVLFLNGIPVATAELKNYKEGYLEAITQYKQTRFSYEKLFKFNNGAIVHFAIDPYEVHMTTKLDGEKTRFLPFNKGRPHEKKNNDKRNVGKGNPEDPDGSYPTSYLWQNIWQKEIWLDILNYFVHLQILKRKNQDDIQEIIFPRYHQLDCVNQLIEQTKKGSEKNFLIEHSTGSGKSNSIAWLAYKLYNLFDKNNDPIYHSIIVLSDRKGIVGQLAETILNFQQRESIVKEMEDTRMLIKHLESESKILVTTQQKFPPALKNVGKIKGKKFAVIIDEAHSSQSGETSKKVERVLEKDLVDELMDENKKQGLSEHITYYAFTATPKRETYQLFGKKKGKGDEAHHYYTMRQAIEEGFILDVLGKYITFEQFFQISKVIPESKLVEGQKGLAAIMKYVQTHEKTVEAKSQVILSDFNQNCRHCINGQAKAMVSTSSRENVVKFKLALDELIAKEDLDGIKTIGAFSGNVTIAGKDYDEHKLNNTKNEIQIREKFNEPDYKILIVAEKYQTGFDQPLLHTMYVDKQLSGIKAVQTLSRLNRSYPNKEDTRVLDFKNQYDEIQRSYEQYYNGGILSQEIDANAILELFDVIMKTKIITKEDLDRFYKHYFANSINQMDRDLGLLFGDLDPIVKRFGKMEENNKEHFRKNLAKYYKWYSFFTRLIKFSNEDLEKLFVIIKFIFVKRIISREGIEGIEPNDLSLKSYKLEKMFEGSISLDKDRSFGWQKDSKTIREPTVLTSLESLILFVNQKFWGSTAPTQEHILIIGEWLDLLKEIPDLRDSAKSNQFHDFKIIFKRKFLTLIVEEESFVQNKDLLTRLFKNKEYFEELIDKLSQLYYTWVHANNIPSVTPANPSQNKLQLRLKIANCREYIHWIDRYLDADAFEFLDAIDPKSIKKIKLLSSVYYDKINNNLREKFIELQQKLKDKGISCEMKVFMTKNLHRQIHDRFIIAENVKYNVPSVAQLRLGQYSEIHPSQISLPFDEWWDSSDVADVVKDWDAIKSKREQLGSRF